MFSPTGVTLKTVGSGSQTLDRYRRGEQLRHQHTGQWRLGDAAQSLTVSVL